MRNYLETVWQDLRFGARNLRGKPTFAVVIIITFTLGIGANTAVFSIVDAVIFLLVAVPRCKSFAQHLGKRNQAA